jgi:hypothetical protein
MITFQRNINERKSSNEEGNGTLTASAASRADVRVLVQQKFLIQS